MAPRNKKQVCPVESAGIDYVDYKDTAFLKLFLTKFNKIVPRQYTGTTLKNQKKVATAIKRARYMALLPYVVDPRHNTNADYSQFNADIPKIEKAEESAE